MAIEVPRALVEFILLGPEDDRRQLQDSPILGDVWVEFAKRPGDRLELLITPYKDQPAGRVATIVADRITSEGANVAYLQGIIAASLTFDEVLLHIVPMTRWWAEKRISSAMQAYLADAKPLEDDINGVLHFAKQWFTKKSDKSIQDLEAHKRYATLAGLILWAQDQDSAKWAKEAPSDAEGSTSASNIEAMKILNKKVAADVVAELATVFETAKFEPEQQSLIWHVSMNRMATPALTKSIPAVKADAARTLFQVNCSEIVWAVIDSGIDATHPAFLDKEGNQVRVKRSFDFTKIRSIVSLDNVKATVAKKRIGDLIKGQSLRNPPDAKVAEEQLQELAKGARRGRPIDWELVERLVEIKPEAAPPSNHGTHVAGILGADGDAARKTAKENAEADTGDWASGMCPDITIYDFRVLAPTLQETEFAIIAALQYIRHVNERNSFITIHGANLSLSIRHDVRNYACGRTPICNECERLVNSGVVVVAAAGNRGYQNFETKDGLYESYAAFSVTDPGNADGVITVGATHRFWPHTYGVSFFSSRGPTGDGRLKPDLVAPGERIRAPLPRNEWGDLDGTSMAAPHVSGAAAMLMARYSELIGQPRRIKQILCESATDLGRERSFQGHGMLDVLRAFQSI
ncbi:MAG TPA: S8 family peptidase [Bryobacteraceae bacterium]|nr:S8 family peptidase [Bryobacteraceae bacterium]